MVRKLNTPITDEIRESLVAGEEVLISGTIYTARDAAHKLMYDAVKGNQPLPFDFEGQIIYYVGPTPAKPNQAIGSCGPTSSYRMDNYSPTLMKQGLKVMIGKGERSYELNRKIQEQKAVYLITIGGIGALLSKTIEVSETIAYSELGPEAIRKLKVKDFPAIVAVDSKGNSVFK
ncbi:MAG: fumarate hydratase C-terminal domain-containing protein [Bacilli bacterium]|nr:fumarate hydratase C-terminal domain-containing protein [Bacilli bacterium]MBN2876529.1 fumarate hydratase C-terminal domain-containing protein [Bacilli bacterium]